MAEQWGFQIQSSLASQHLTDAKYIQGGYIVVKDTTARDKLPVKTETSDGVVLEGSLVYVSDDKKSYRYTNSAWVEESADIKIDDETITKNSDDELVSTTKAFKKGSTTTETYTVNKEQVSSTFEYTIPYINDSYRLTSAVMSSGILKYKKCSYTEVDEDGNETSGEQSTGGHTADDFTVTFDSTKTYKNITFAMYYMGPSQDTATYKLIYDVTETKVVEDSVVDMQEKIDFTYDADDGNKITKIDGHEFKYYKGNWNTSDINDNTYIYNKPNFCEGLNYETSIPTDYLSLYKHNLITDEYTKLNSDITYPITFDFSEDTAAECTSTDDNVVEWVVSTKIPISNIEVAKVQYSEYRTSLPEYISLIADVGLLFTKTYYMVNGREIKLYVKEKTDKLVKIGYTFGPEKTGTSVANTLKVSCGSITKSLDNYASTNNVSVNYDNDTIKVNEEGKLYANTDTTAIETAIGKDDDGNLVSVTSRIKSEAVNADYEEAGDVTSEHYMNRYTSDTDLIISDPANTTVKFNSGSEEEPYWLVITFDDDGIPYLNDVKCEAVESDPNLYSVGFWTYNITTNRLASEGMRGNVTVIVHKDALSIKEKIEEIETNSTNVIANPTGDATAKLSKLKVDDTIYDTNEIAVKESDGTINEEKVNLVIEDLSPKEVYDKNGHLYGYTQIGDKYWMTSNYRYDDGRETGIIYNHYITNETDEQKGLLYTFSAMKDIELPEGWRIPTIKDWHDLFAEAGIEKYNVNSPDVTGAWNEENQTYNRTGSNVWAEDDHDYAGPMKILWSTEVFAESDDVFGLSFYRTGRGNAFDEINPEEEAANDQSNLWGIDTAESAVSAWNIQGIFENGVNYTNIRTRIKNAQAIRLVKDV